MLLLLILAISLIGQASGSRIMYDSYTGSDNANMYISTTTARVCQTFSLISEGSGYHYHLTNVSLKMYQTGTDGSKPGTITVELYAVDGSHKPTGSILNNGSIDGESITTSSPGSYYSIEFNTKNYPIQKSIEYALVVKASNPDGSNRLSVRAISSGAYSYGQAFTSTDSGSTWSSSTNDVPFYAFGRYEDITIVALDPYDTETEYTYHVPSEFAWWTNFSLRYQVNVTQPGETQGHAYCFENEKCGDASLHSQNYTAYFNVFDPNDQYSDVIEWGHAYDWSINITMSDTGYYENESFSFDLGEVVAPAPMSSDPGNAWHLASVPVFEDTDFDTVRVRNATQNYTFNEAIDEGIVVNTIFGWDIANQQYEIDDVFSSYHGYWIWFYEDDYTLWVAPPECETGEIVDNSSENWVWISGFSLEDGELGLSVVAIIFILAFIVDRQDKQKSLWKPIMLFLDVPIALATGIFYLGSGLFTIGFWIGVIMISFSIIMSMGGLYYGLSFGRN